MSINFQINDGVLVIKNLGFLISDWSAAFVLIDIGEKEHGPSSASLDGQILILEFTGYFIQFIDLIDLSYGMRSSIEIIHTSLGATLLQRFQ